MGGGFLNRVIINADDFGLNHQCTKAIYEAWQNRLITDTSMVANGKDFDNVLLFASTTDLFNNIGIHFNLTEGVPLSERIKKCSLFVKNGIFHGEINRKRRLTRDDSIAVSEELSAQVERIQRVGISITHADSHHHIHTAPFITPIVIHVCRQYGIKKIRAHRNIGNMSFCKRAAKTSFNWWLQSQGFRITDYFGSMNDVKGKAYLGCLEIMVHPDYDRNGVLIDRVGKDGNYYTGDPLQLPMVPGNYELTSYKEL